MDRVADPIIWEFARQNEYTIVTKDSDFSDLSLLRGHPPKVIWIKLGNCTTSQVEEAIRRRSQEIADFETDSVIGLLTILG